MKQYKYLLLLWTLVFISSCASYKEPGMTMDWPPSDENTLQNTIHSQISFQKADQSDMMLQLSRISRERFGSNQEKITIYLHPIDSEGRFISSLDNKQFVCSVIDSSYGNEKRIENFSYEQLDSDIPVSIAFVMDHSGSMGRERVRAQQEEIYKFLRDKSDRRDEVYLIKYDHIIDNLPYPGKENVSDIKSSLVNGFGVMGGGTALYDAVGEAIKKLSTSRYANRIVVVLTDGLENSSMNFRSGAQLTKLARDHGVAIASIGFGDNIDKPLLADTLALETGGIYHHIGRTDDFRLVFEDIYNRMKTGYKLTYTIESTFGMHSIKVELCLPKIKLATVNNYQNPINPDSIIVVNNIFFATNSDQINKEKSREALSMIEMIMKNYPDMEIEVRGHTDSTGTAELNADLSQRRAEAVVKALTAAGIDKFRMKYVGLGESAPVADNGSEEGRKLNRRVEFKINKFYANKGIRPIEPIYKTPSQTIVKVAR